MHQRSPNAQAPTTSSNVDDYVRSLEAAVAEKEQMPQRQEVMELITSGKHVLIGAKALAYYTEPRFTQDTDYVVAGQTFRRIRKWAKDNEVAVEDLGLVLRLHTLGLDVIDGRSNAVFKELLEREPPKPSPEALAATKYISFTNQQRGHRRLQDVADFSQLVTLAKFDEDRLQSYLVGEYAALWPEVAGLIADIRAGRPITI